VRAKVARKSEEGRVLLAHIMANADGGEAVIAEAQDGASRAAQPTLQGLYLLGRGVEMLLE
jgi:hypothetical protein